MSQTHRDLAALASAYAIGALDADDHAVFATHLAGCLECAADVREATRITDALARAVPQIAPRPEVRVRLLKAIQQTSPAATWRPAPAAASWSRHLLAAAVLIAAALGIYALTLRARVAALESRLDAAAARLAVTERTMNEARRVALESQAAIGVLAAPDLARIDLAGQPSAPSASARALWSRRHGLLFAAQNLPALPPGRTYQVWVVTANAPVSAGLFEPDPAGRGIAVFVTPPDIDAPIAIAVTIEPAGGVDSPTGDRYLIGAPAA